MSNLYAYTRIEGTITHAIEGVLSYNNEITYKLNYVAVNKMHVLVLKYTCTIDLYCTSVLK